METPQQPEEDDSIPPNTFARPSVESQPVDTFRMVELCVTPESTVIQISRAAIEAMREDEHVRAELRRMLLPIATQPGTKVCFSPGAKLTREEFQDLFPAGSIAGDGSMTGEPGVYDGTHANFDHHEGQGRAEMKAMCEQVLDFMGGDIPPAFVDEQGQLRSILFLNHLDLDNGFAAVLLQTYQGLTEEQRQKLAQLVRNAGRMDAMGGCYPLCVEHAECLKWIGEQITQARKGDWLMERLSPEDKLRILQNVRERVVSALEGSASRLPLETESRVIVMSDRFRIIEEIGPDARWSLARMGITTFMSYRGTNTSQKHLYSFVHLTEDAEARAAFPVNRLYDDLNALEAIDGSYHDAPLEAQWMEAEKLLQRGGTFTRPFGGNGIGGSFEGGSRFRPEQLGRVITFLLGMYDRESIGTGTRERVAALVG